jgi:hypothetical protein
MAAENNVSNFDAQKVCLGFKVKQSAQNNPTC